MARDTKKLLRQNTTFLKIGAFTFGGGYAMIPLIQKEVVEKQKWLTDADILDIVAIAESTPGPIAINSATFVGYQTSGVIGAFLATVGVILPSFLVILLVSFLLRQFGTIKPLQYAFQGIRAGVLALIANALFSMYRPAPKHLFSYLIMLTAFILVAFAQVNVIFVILGCGIAGILFCLFSKRRIK